MVTKSGLPTTANRQSDEQSTPWHVQPARLLAPFTPTARRNFAIPPQSRIAKPPWGEYDVALIAVRVTQFSIPGMSLASRSLLRPQLGHSLAELIAPVEGIFSVMQPPGRHGSCAAS